MKKYWRYGELGQLYDADDNPSKQYHRDEDLEEIVFLIFNERGDWSIQKWSSILELLFFLDDWGAWE